MREKYDARLRDNQRKVAQVRRLSKAHDSLMTNEMKKERRKRIKKEMSIQETDDKEYPKTTSMKRQSTISTSQSSSSTKTTTSNTKNKTETTKKTATGNINNSY